MPAFRNITVKNCRIEKSNRGISLQLRDNGSIENIHFENISIECRLFSQEHWWGDGEPIAITAVKRNKDTAVGCARDISFDNISCECENGILVYGDSSINIDGISFNNLKMHIKNKTNERRYTKDLRPCDETPTVSADPSCFYACHAGNISIKEFEIRIDPDMSEYFKPFVVVNDCPKAIIDWKSED